MLCTLCRIWARRAGEDISAWMLSLNQDWIANGLKRASEQAAYDVAMEVEAAANDRDNIDITLEKGFENVRHGVLRDRAAHYHIPVPKLNLAFSMYKGRKGDDATKLTVNVSD